MTLCLELGEAATAPVRPLTPAQVATLAAVPELVTVTPAGAGLWRLAGRQRVGTVRLGAGEGMVELRIHPKLPIRRLLALLDASDIWQPQQVTAARDDLLVPALADLLARVADRTLRGGVLHGYVHHEDALTMVRGRIRTSAHISRRVGLPMPLEVAYDDHTAEIPENQILLGALDLAGSLPNVGGRTRQLLRHLGARLMDVTPVRPGMPLPAWRPTRLNERYVPALRLSELLLSGASLQQRGTGAVQMDGFILNMAQVFERFLTRRLATAFKPYGLRCEAQQQHRLDRQGRVPFRPDIIGYGGGRPAMVIDAKYLSLNGSPPTEHLYQLIAYCTALGLRDGHLVYAGGTTEAEPYRITHSEITVHAHVLDLDQEYDQLQRAVGEIAEQGIDTHGLIGSGGGRRSSRRS